jgi:hypothetical protein
MVLDKNLNTVISVDFETTDESPFTIRVTSDDDISILDVVEHVTQQSRGATRKSFSNFLKDNSEVEEQIRSFKFKGRGQLMFLIKFLFCNLSGTTCNCS